MIVLKTVNLGAVPSGSMLYMLTVATRPHPQFFYKQNIVSCIQMKTEKAIVHQEDKPFTSG